VRTALGCKYNLSFTGAVHYTEDRHVALNESDIDCRNGTWKLFAALEIASGQVFAQLPVEKASILIIGYL
jgi:hypothetical protein